VRRLIRIVEEIDVGGSGQHMWIEPVHNGTAQETGQARGTSLFDLGPAVRRPAPGVPGGANSKSGGLNKVIATNRPTL